LIVVVEAAEVALAVRIVVFGECVEAFNLLADGGLGLR